MAVQSLLAGEMGKARSLGEVAVVAWHDVELEVEAAQSDQADYVIGTDRGGTRFPPGDGGLSGPGPRGEFGLSGRCGW